MMIDNCTSAGDLNSTSGIEPFQVVTACFLLFTGSVGIILNSAFLALALCKKELQSDYSLFLNSGSVLLLVYSLNNATLEAFVVIKNKPGCSTICLLASIIFVSSGLSASCVKPFYALYQYWTLYYPEKITKYFSAKKSPIMVICTCIVCLILALIRFAVKDLGRVVRTFCGVYLGTTQMIVELVFVIPTAIFTKICVFCALKMRRSIKSTDREVQKQLESNLPDAKIIVRFIFVEVFVPVLLEMPQMIVSMVIRAKGEDAVSSVLVAVVVCLPMLSSVVYPIFIVYFLKQYRQCALNVWHQVTCNRPNDIKPYSAAELTAVAA